MDTLAFEASPKNNQSAMTTITPSSGPGIHSHKLQTTFPIVLHQRPHLQGSTLTLKATPTEDCPHFGSYRHLFVEIDNILINWVPGWVNQVIWLCATVLWILIILNITYYTKLSSEPFAVVVIAVVSLLLLITFFKAVKYNSDSKAALESHLDDFSRKTGMKIDISWVVKKGWRLPASTTTEPVDPSLKDAVGFIIIKHPRIENSTDNTQAKTAVINMRDPSKIV